VTKQPESLPQRRRKYGPLHFYDSEGNEIAVREWGLLFEVADRQVALTELGHTTVDTVWMGMTRYFDETGRPLVYETLVWGKTSATHLWATRGEALAGHRALCDTLLAGVSAPARSIVCPRCGIESHHPEDVAQRYCGNCHDWHPDDPRP